MQSKVLSRSIFFLNFVIFCQTAIKPHSKLSISFYCSARFYAPRTGQFIHADTKTPTSWGVGLNRYAYAYNNSLKYSDPSGHVPQDVFDGAQTTLNKLAQLGADVASKGDKTLYSVMKSLLGVWTPPNLEGDPIGFTFYTATVFIAGGAGSGLADDIIRDMTDDITRGPFIGPPYKPALNATRDSTALRQLEAAGRREAAIAKRMELTEVEAVAQTNSLDTNIRFKTLELAIASARQSTLSAIAMENEAAQIFLDEAQELAGHLSSLITNQLNSTTPLGQISVGGRFSPEVVQAFERGWQHGGTDFTVSHDPIKFDPGRNRATRATNFHFLGQNTFLRVRAGYTRHNYVRLRNEANSSQPQATTARREELQELAAELLAPLEPNRPASIRGGD